MITLGPIAANRRRGGGGSPTISQIYPAPASSYPSAMAANVSGLIIPFGDTSYVSVPNHSSLNPTQMTIEWRGYIVTDSGANAQVLLEKPFTSHTAPFYQYAIRVRPSDNLVAADYTVGGTRYVASATGVPEIVVGVRLRIAATFDGSNIRLYVNERLIATTAASGSINSYATTLYFGRHGNLTTETAEASYDEVRFWNVARTHKQLIQYADRQLVGTETNLAALWLFNENTGTAVNDSTSNANHGTTAGSVTWSTTTHTWDGTNNEKWHFPNRLTIPTYEGSGQLVHPSVVYIPGGFNGYTFWMAMTPYPSGNNDYENPSIVASNDGFTWVVPGGLTNPVIADPGGSDFNSDACLLAMDNGGTPELWMYYRDWISSVERVRLVKSTDGVTWGSPVTVRTGAAGNMALSPWIFHTGSGFVMLGVNDDFAVRRWTSSDGEAWTLDGAVTVSGLPGGRSAWHLEGTRDPSSSRLHIMFDSATDGLGTGARLHYAYSDDEGATITIVDYLTVALYTGDTHEYKASILADPTYLNRYWIWGANRVSAATWHPNLIMRRLASGDLYQENALP